MWLYHANVVLGQFLRPYWRLGLRGEVDRIPRRGPLLVASNHQSFLDPWLIGFIFPRPVHYLMTERWYYRSPLWRFFFSSWGTVPVSEGNAQGTIDAICGVLARGEVCGIFPEGRISDDGRMARFRPGIARMAAQSGAPVVPLGIRGSFRTLPRGRRFPRPETVKIHVGPPLVFPDSPRQETPSRRETVDFTQDVLRAVCRAAGQEERIDSLLQAGRGRGSSVSNEAAAR
jgi:1-acyl-sn-glycerol-3-phosphate acyltransferase